ncbi:MAG TPA: hypothetical protein VGT03_07020 [Candidatus Acidoferrales bacterium]|nr:hypothetical protein [Candidatus Acidoferrales bacterium]
MSRYRASNLISFVAAAAMILVACAAPRVAQAQTNHANDTFMVVSRTDGGRVVLHVDGRGNHCWATTSDDESSGITMGDDLCNAWEEGGDEEGSLVAKITPSKISFHLSGKAYVIADAATVKKTRGLFDPLIAIDDQQMDLGAKQRQLGEKQRELGRQQREVKVKVPDMSADIRKVEADAKKLNTDGGTQSELGDLQSELGDLQSRLGDLQSQAGEQQSKFGDQQSELGDQQSTFGDQQSALAEKGQGTARNIGKTVRDMLTQAVKDGTAKSE